MQRHLTLTLMLNSALLGPPSHHIRVPDDSEGRTEMLRALLALPGPRVALTFDGDWSDRLEGFAPDDRDRSDDGSGNDKKVA